MIDACDGAWEGIGLEMPTEAIDYDNLIRVIQKTCPGQHIVYCQPSDLFHIVLSDHEIKSSLPEWKDRVRLDRPGGG